MTNPYSQDLRERAVDLVEMGMSVKKVALLLKIGAKTIYLWLKRKLTEGTIEARKNWRKGHSCKVTDLEEFKEFVENHQGLTAKEMAEIRGISTKTMCKWLKRIDFTRKKKTYGSIERDEESRSLYKETIALKSPDSLVYLDESGIDDNEEYPYAWGKKGTRIHALKPASRKKRLSIIIALNVNSLKAPFVFEGYCNRDIFQAYLANVLLPELKPGQTIIMDNARFHKGGTIKKLIESARCQLLYLPTYSPDLNPVEHKWASIKYHIKRKLPLYNRNLYDTVKAILKKMLPHK